MTENSHNWVIRPIALNINIMIKQKKRQQQKPQKTKNKQQTSPPPKKQNNKKTPNKPQNRNVAVEI